LAVLLWLLETGIDCDSYHILVWLAARHGSGCPGSWPRCVIPHAALGFPARRVPLAGFWGHPLALTGSGAPGRWGRPVRRDCGSGRGWADAGIDWPRTCLRLLLLSKSAIVKTPAVLTVGVSLCLWTLSSGGGRPAA